LSIKAFFSDLFRKPESFSDDAYAYLTNQIGHVFFGATFPMYVIAASYYLSGQYPNQTAIAVQFVISYLIGWELVTQGWRGLDTILDATFVAIGATFYIIVEMDIVLVRMLVIYTVIYALLLGTTYRVWAINRSKGNQ